MSKRLLLSVAVILLAGSGVARAENYEQCLLIVDRDPDRAYQIATEWRDYGGGARAEHCMALALVGQGKYDRAAELLDEMAQAFTQDDTAKGRSPGAITRARADLLSQAGNAWLLAKAPDKAYMRFSDALDPPGLPLEMRAELLVDRARAGADLNDQEKAIEDLNAAIEITGPRPDILTYRGAAERALGSLQKARADIDAALELDPDFYEALFERGHLKLEVGNEEGAVTDWLEVTYLAPDTPAALAAEANVKKLRADQEARKNGGGEASPSTPDEPLDPSPVADAPSEVPSADPAAPAP